MNTQKQHKCIRSLLTLLTKIIDFKFLEGVCHKHNCNKCEIYSDFELFKLSFFQKTDVVKIHFVIVISFEIKYLSARHRHRLKKQKHRQKNGRCRE